MTRREAVRLRGLEAPGEAEARVQAREVAGAAFADRRHRARRPGRLRALLAAATGVVAVALAFTPPGDAVADWVERALTSPPERTALEELPGGGKVLVLAGGAPTIVRDGEPERLLGRVREATWSPHGRFVAAARGSELVAVDLDGRRRWSVAADGAVSAPRWSPSGYRVAYVAGGTLRVVNGDGTGDRRVGPTTGVAPAWRPGRDHVVAFPAAQRRVVVADLDSRTVLRRIRRVPQHLRTVAFSAKGDRLLLVGEREVHVRGGRSFRLLQRLRPRPGTRHVTAAYAPRGRRFALVSLAGSSAEVTLAEGAADTIRTRLLFAAGQVGPIAFAPDGRHLLVDWRETGAWLFLPLDGGRTRQVPDVAERFGEASAILQGWAP